MASSRNELVDLLRQYARRYGIDEAIAIAQIQQESSFNPRASSGEAHGIAQFTPPTARRFGVDVWNVESSFDGWGRYMRWLLDRFHGDYSLALAGYNAGEGNVDKYGGIPPFSETRHYVAVILENAGRAPSGDLNNPVGDLNDPALSWSNFFADDFVFPLPPQKTEAGTAGLVAIGIVGVVLLVALVD